MKTIGFVDYYISEWHANNYPKWIKEICQRTNEDICLKYAFAEEYVSPVDGRNTDLWCEAFGVERCYTIDELCQKADYIIVLAPSNPEKHLEYARAVLKYQKNTYIDKTFAVGYGDAREIFDIADKYKTKIFSSSALRYAEGLDSLVGADAVITTGGGGNFDEYIIHQIEMLVKVMDAHPAALRLEKQGEQYICTVDFGDKRGTMIYSNRLDFCVMAQKGEGARTETLPIKGGYFISLIEDILRFFKTGECSFDVNQTLDVMKIRGAAVEAKSRLCEWISI